MQCLTSLRILLKYLTVVHTNYTDVGVTEITTLKRGVLQKLVVAHRVKKPPTFDGI
jgi:hypothetical protein